MYSCANEAPIDQSQKGRGYRGGVGDVVVAAALSGGGDVIASAVAAAAVAAAATAGRQRLFVTDLKWCQPREGFDWRVRPEKKCPFSRLHRKRNADNGGHQ